MTRGGEGAGVEAAGVTAGVAVGDVAVPTVAAGAGVLAQLTSNAVRAAHAQRSSIR